MDAGLALNNTFQGFPVNNGCLKIILRHGALTHIVLSNIGMTFHWKDDRRDTQERLAEIKVKLNLKTKDGLYEHHNVFHFDNDDAKYPHLHSHFKLKQENQMRDHLIRRILAELLESNHITHYEFARSCWGILAFKAWE